MYTTVPHLLKNSLINKTNTIPIICKMITNIHYCNVIWQEHEDLGSDWKVKIKDKGKDKEIYVKDVIVEML